MFSNFSNFLSGSLRILGIANRAIPLVREITPVVKKARTKLSNSNMPKLNLIQPPKITQQNNLNNQTPKKEIPKNNNSLTFFQ